MTMQCDTESHVFTWLSFPTFEALMRKDFSFEVRITRVSESGATVTMFRARSVNPVLVAKRVRQARELIVGTIGLEGYTSLRDEFSRYVSFAIENS